MTQSDQAPRRRILVVDPHHDTNRPMVRLLQLGGYDAVGAVTRAEARSAAAAGRFDVIISRVFMPDGDAKDFMREVRDATGARGLAMGGWRDEAQLPALREAGFADYLEMPIMFERLKAEIERLIETGDGNA